MSTDSSLAQERFPVGAEVPKLAGTLWSFDATRDPKIALSQARQKIGELLAARSTRAVELGQGIISELAQNAERHGGGLQAVSFALVESDVATVGLAVFAMDRNPKPAVVEPSGSTAFLDELTDAEASSIIDALPEGGWGVEDILTAPEIFTEGQFQTGNGNALWSAFITPDEDYARV